MRQKELKVEQVFLEVARDSSDEDLSGEAASWAGRIWDRGEATTALGAYPMGPGRREPADPSPKVFLSEVAPVTGKLLRWDDKSHSSARSAIPWAARGGDSGAQTLRPAQ